MSSPNENAGPPPDNPPDTPQPPEEQPTPVSTQHAQDAPAAPQTPSSATQDQPSNATQPQTGSQNQSQGQARNPRPLSSLSLFLPLRQENGNNNAEDGRMGWTWTFEVFPNDGGDEIGPLGGDGTPVTGEAASEATPAGPPNPSETPANPAANAAEGPAPAPAATPTPAGGPEGGDAPRPPGNVERSWLFIFGPDGAPIGGGGAGGPQMRRGEGGGAAPAGNPGANFWFPFGLPFNFTGPPAPDPAKAAELLASLPTIGRALLRRVDKVIVAEDAAGGKMDDERGWRCGICLDGLDVDADSPPSAHPVKGLPCNHLFHEECLEPWFTSHHTCPTCRLDLDPLRTLRGPRETRGNPLRPAATGSGRATPRNAPHPYARDREAAARSRSRPQTPANPLEANPAVAPADGENQPQTTQTQTQTQNQTENQSQSQNESQTATPAATAPAGAPPPGAPPFTGLGLSEILSHLVAQATSAAFGELAPGSMFNNPMTASPTPMDRATATPGNLPVREEPASPTRAAATAAGAPAGGSTGPTEAEPADRPAEIAENAADGPGLLRPTPARRPHIHFLNHLFPPTQGTPGTGTPATATDAPTPATDDAAPTPANPTNAAPTPGPANGAGDGAPGGAGAPGRPPRNMPPLDFLIFAPFGMGRGPEQDAPAEPPRENESPSQPFVPQSLGSWTEQREKTLGWRCDAVECLVASPVPDETSEEMDVDDDEPLSASDKEMLSIYTPLQPPFATADVANNTSDLVLVACPHRWHRTCLETAERSAGHRALPDESGREWVRCQKCRKEGWVTPRSEDARAVSPVGA